MIGAWHQSRITLPDQIQLSDTAKDVPAKRNGSLGIKFRLGYNTDHAGSMNEKTKTSWEHFYKGFINKQVRKIRFIGVYKQG